MTSPIHCLHCGAVRESRPDPDAITSPKFARSQFAKLADAEQEQFAVLTLTTRNTAIGVHIVAP